MNATTASALNMSTSTRSTLDQNSVATSCAQLPVNISLTFFNITGMLGNVLLFWIVARNPTMRSKFYYSLLHLTAADGLFCAYDAILSLKRVTICTLNMPETQAPLSCMPWLFIAVVFQNASPAQALCIAIDRFVAVAAPTRYASIQTRHMQILNALAWVIPTAILGVLAIFVSPAPLIANCAAGVWKPFVNTGISALGVVITSVSVLLYIALIALLRGRLSAAKKDGHQTFETLKKTIQYRATITGCMLGGVYTFMYLGSQIYLFLGSLLIQDMTTKIHYLPLSSLILILGINMSLIIFMGRNTEIKKAFENTFGIVVAKSNKVMPLVNKPAVNLGSHRAGAGTGSALPASVEVVS